VPHTGLQPRGYFSVREAIWESLKRLYYNILSKIEMVLSAEERNREIGQRYLSGESVPRLAKAFGVSKPRIYQILKGLGR
jgi:Mor family transcriptional regulator